MKPIPILVAAVVAASLGLASCGRAPQSDGYPLTTCVVSGESLDSMGEPVSFVHEGTEVRLCCSSCREDFDKDPAKYLAKLKP